jgi:hypothetical protein
MKLPGSPTYGYNFTVTDRTDTALRGPTFNARGQQIGGVFNPYNPQQAIALEAFFLRQLLEQYGGDPIEALAAYNAGPGDLAAGMGYAQMVEGAAAQVQALTISVAGKVLLISALTNAVLGIADLEPQQVTIDLSRQHAGAKKPVHRPKPKRR